MRPPRSSLAHVLADLRTALAGVHGSSAYPWYLFGARAGQLRGLRRATVDVDVTILSGSRDASQVLAALEQAFTLRVLDVDDFVLRTRVLPMVHGATGVPLDAVLGGPGLEEYFFERAELLVHDGVPVYVPLAADLVVMKLLAGRAHDLDDAIELVLFDRAAVDLAGVRILLTQIEAGVGEGGFIDALDRLEHRVATAATPDRDPGAAREQQLRVGSRRKPPKRR